MAEYLKLKKSNCVNCYKCIRHCPVKSIKYSTGQAQIVNDECILCGQCFVVCPQNAKEIRNDVPSAINLLKAGPVYASLAPSFVANYPGATIATMEKALKQLGFAGVEETAIGASIVKTEYENIVREGPRINHMAATDTAPSSFFEYTPQRNTRCGTRKRYASPRGSRAPTP